MVTVEQQLEDLSAKVEKLSASVDFATNRVTTLTTNVSNLADMVTTVLNKVTVVNRWSREADKFATDLEATMQNITSRVMALEQAHQVAPPNAPSREEGGRANGRGDPTGSQGVPMENPLPHATLIKGEHSKFQTPPITLHTDYVASKFSQYEDESSRGYQSNGVNRDFRMPRIDFPRFEGEHPRIWKEKCEKYFRMCTVPPELWAPFATLHFHGTTAY
jgi:hypothetical protein